MTARLLLLASVLPFAGLAQLELTLYDATTAPPTETPVGSSLNVGSAAVCQKLKPRFRIHNLGADAPGMEIITLLVQSTDNPPDGAFKTDSGDPLPGSSFLIGPYSPPGVGTGPPSFRDIWIDFAPGNTGNFTATLTVAGKDIATSTVYTITVALQGTGVAAPTLTDSNGVSYCPGGVPIQLRSAQLGTTLQTALTLTNPTQSALTAAIAEVTPTAGGHDFGLTMPGPVAAGATQTLQIAFTPSIPTAETGTLTLSGLAIPLVYQVAGLGLASPPLEPTLTLPASCCQSGTQAQVQMPLSGAASSTDTGTLTLAFQPSGGLPNDSTIMFVANSSRTVNVKVNPGETAVQFQAGDGTFQTGATAGTITFTLNLTVSGATATASTTILPAIVALDQSSAAASTDSILLSLAGFDNTHKASSLSFTFYNTAGKVITQIPVDVTTAFTNYYSAHPEAGGTFKLQATFPVAGDITQVAGVDVQFTNPAGATSPPRLAVQ